MQHPPTKCCKQAYDPVSPFPRRYVGNRTGTTGAALAIGTGIWTYSRHRPGSVMDVVPGDAVSSTILLAAAAAVQVHVIRARTLNGIY